MPGSVDLSFRPTHEPVPHRFESMDDDLTRPTQAKLAALRKTEMTVGLRKQIGRSNVQTFSRAGSGIASLKSPLVAQNIVDPYVNHLKDTGQLTDQHVSEILRGMVSQLGKPALAQQMGNPPQYVSHGFDHSERVAAYTDMIVKAFRFIAASSSGFGHRDSRRPC